MVSTTLLTEGQLVNTYGYEIKKTLQILSGNENVDLHHGVDVNNLSSEILEDEKPDIAVFNFPYAPGDDN